MSNRAFLRAANSLTHPVTIGAIGLLLLNDHILRIHWPSWWTGKLGDLNGDNSVNISDFGIFLGRWGTGDQNADFNHSIICRMKLAE